MAELTKIVYDGSGDRETAKDTFPRVLRDLFQTDPDVVYLDADLMNSFGTQPLAAEMPERCIDCGIQEANMIGVAAGMSAVGKKPYVHTFGPFASRRVFDQAFLSIAYAHNNVRIVGSDPGVTAAFNGGTHMPFEDTALYRVVPGAMIVDVVDSAQFEWALRSTKDRPGLTYIRTPRKGGKQVYPENAQFQEGKAAVLRDGKDVLLVGAGIMVAEMLAAAEKLAAEGIEAAVIDVVTVKPLDCDTIVEYAKKCGAVLTAENADELGGMAAAVTACLAAECPVPVLSIGSGDRFGQVGPEDYLRKEYGLTAENVVEKAKAVLAKKAK